MEEKRNASSETIHVGGYEFDANEKLGQGAYGTVFKGHKCFDGEPVALKRVPSELMKNVEMDSPVKTRCPYIVDFLDVITVKSEDMTYMVMELCDTDLRQFLTSYGPLKPDNLDLLAKCLAEGYAAMSSSGIVHRDIKPENIMLKLDQNFVPTKIENENLQANAPPVQPRINVAKFGDFGCSRSDIEAKVAGIGGGMRNLAGTLHYMAPEVGANVVESHAYDCKVDMWSMGVVLFECATGRAPFDEREICKLFLKATTGNFHFKAPIAEGCPEKYQKIIGALLSLNPASRLSAKDFRDCVFDHGDNPKKLLFKRQKDNKNTKSGKTKKSKKLHSCALFSRLLTFAAK